MSTEDEGGSCHGRRLPSADIFPVGRVEPSGSTAQITNYLSTNPEWALGQGFTVNWPKCVQRVQGTNGIIAYLQAHPNGIGCAPESTI